jgi:hypothetical protein
MSDIPSANDLLATNQAKATDKFQGPIWNSTKETATKNFKDNAGYLGQGPIDCVEIFRLNSGNVANATEHKELFTSMFDEKGYQIRAGYTCEKLFVGREPTVRNQQFVFYVCIK